VRWKIFHNPYRVRGPILRGIRETIDNYFDRFARLGYRKPRSLTVFLTHEPDSAKALARVGHVKGLYATYEMIINAWYLIHFPDNMLKWTIPHEVAHIASRQKHGLPGWSWGKNDHPNHWERAMHAIDHPADKTAWWLTGTVPPLKEQVKFLQSFERGNAAQRTVRRKET
jgi:hypothetical protein